MVKLKFILIFILLLSAKGTVHSQEPLAILTIGNIQEISATEFEFELLISRQSNEWQRFVNGTFNIYFPDSDRNFDKTNIGIVHLFSQLEEKIIVGVQELPVGGYFIESNVYENRIAITILGPKIYQECQIMPYDDIFLLGKFRVSSLDGVPLPTKPRWLEPYDYYQALAYKLEEDRVFNELEFVIDDNIEMTSFRPLPLQFDVNPYLGIDYRFKMFIAEYTGQQNSELKWETESEVLCVGYTIMRAPNVSGTAEAKDLVYTDTVASHISGEYFDPEMFSKGVSSEGFRYGIVPDFLQYRGGKYCYTLIGTFTDIDGATRDSVLDYDCIDVPNAVIVKATPAENPFRIETTIQYEVLDDVILTVGVYDLTGRFIKHLVDPTTGQVIKDLFIPRGEHVTTFRASDFASQGMYDVIFIADPINDRTVEMSRAVVKTVLLKD